MIDFISICPNLFYSFPNIVLVLNMSHQYISTMNKFLPKLQTILGGSQIPRRRPTKESEFNAAISHARSTLFNTTNSQAIF